jgi:hypothetical protein
MDKGERMPAGRESSNGAVRMCCRAPPREESLSDFWQTNSSLTGKILTVVFAYLIKRGSRTERSSDHQ